MIFKEHALAGDVGNRLVALRHARHLSQRQLAVIAHVDAMQVSRYERGERAPSISNLASLAEALGVTADELLFGRRDEQPIRNPRLLDRFRELDQLDEATISMVVNILDSLLEVHGVGLSGPVVTPRSRQKTGPMIDRIKASIAEKARGRNDG